MKIINRFEDNIELNDNISYIISLEINDTPANIYMNDAGQCYFFTYVQKGQIIERTCGTYNMDFIEYVIHTLDKKGWYIYSLDSHSWDMLMEHRAARGLENIDTDKYDTYTSEEIDNIYNKIFGR